MATVVITATVGALPVTGAFEQEPLDEVVAACLPRRSRSSLASEERAPHRTDAALAGWLDFFNRRRPHGAL